MARPTNKIALLHNSDEQFESLQQLVASLIPVQQEAEFPFIDRDRNVRDILGHLHEWHLMMLTWYRVGMQGKKPEMPAAGYTWKTLPALNLVIWQKYQSVDLATAKVLLQNSDEQVTQLILQHSQEELFTKKYYPWTGTTSLGSYLISSTTSHYKWANKKLKKYRSSLLISDELSGD